MWERERDSKSAREKEKGFTAMFWEKILKKVKKKKK